MPAVSSVYQQTPTKNEKEKGKKRKGPNSLVDSIGIILRLNRDAAAALDLLRLALDALRALEVGTPVHPVARVQHDAGLVGAQLGLDARELARERQHDRVLGRVLDQPVAVVALARAVGAAVAREAGEVARVADGQVRGRRKVVDGARLGRQDLAGGKRALVALEVALRVGQRERVLPDLGRRRVAERVEIEVGVLGQEEGWITRVSKVCLSLSLDVADSW